MIRIPASPSTAQIVGLPTKLAPIQPVPTDTVNWPAEGLRIGYAMDAAGEPIDIRVGQSDLVLHTQVLGVPGSGKSTLLAALVQDAAAAGIGVTVLEGHGALVTRIIDELSPAAARRALVVRSADPEHPVPVNPIGPDPTGLMQHVFLEVLYDIFDHQRIGIIGPRFERIYGQMMDAQRLLLGNRATITAIPHLLSSTDALKRLVVALEPLDPELARSIRTELAENRGSDLAEVMAWVNSKFQRLASSPDMRKITGTGRDAVDVTHIVDTQQILLIDLASTTLGAGNSRLLGEMWLAKHWAAMTRRAAPATPHLLVVDEAHLFGAGLLPRIIAEGRKFGIAVAIAHQHLEQLAPALREAALAATNNVIVFRSGPREAATSTTRLGTWPGASLTRLPRLTAAVTLSIGHEQSEPFTLHIDHNDRVASTSAGTVAARNQTLVQERSRQLLVDPHRGAAIVSADLIRETMTQSKPGKHRVSSTSGCPTKDETHLSPRER